MSSGYIGAPFFNSSPHRPCLDGGSWKKGGSGEHEDARERGLLSKEALVRAGVGGSCDTSLSEGKKSGDVLRSDGGGEHGGDGERERDPLVSSRGRKAKRPFCLFIGGRAGGRCERCGGCHVGA